MEKDITVKIIQAMDIEATDTATITAMIIEEVTVVAAITVHTSGEF